MKAVMERKRLVALLAVLFLMSGVFSVIAAASPEDPAKTEPAQKVYTQDDLKVSEAIRIESAIVKRALFEKQRDEAISARAQENTVPVEEAVITEPDAAPAEPEYIPEEIYTEPEPAAEYTAEPEYVEEYIPEEAYTEPEYVPEEVYTEPEYVPEEVYTEPEYVPEEVYTEPEYVPEEVYYEPEEPVYTEPVPEPQPEPEPVPEAAPAPAEEAVPESNLTFLGNFALSAYCPCTACCGPYASGHTASGTVATEGVTVAMDGLEFGTKLMINGHIYTVEDRGTPYGLVDIFFAEHSSARAFGLQYADVYLVE